MEDMVSDCSVDSRFVQSLELLVENGDYGFERGPKYGEYARLRESKLRMKRDFDKILKEEEVRFGFTRDQEEENKVLPGKKTRFGFDPNKRMTPVSCSLAQSVPDFSSLIRKENRRPVNSNLIPRRTELTPPSMKSRNVRESVSASAGEKKGIGMMRKSYAVVEDLKKISTIAASAINGGGGGGGGRKSIGGGGRRQSIGGGGRRQSIGGGGGGRPILGYRQIC